AARMIITDTGAGIPPAERDHIFDRFRSGSELTDSRRTGLGLALVRAVARAHGGEALVRSTPGHGSEVELGLPVTAPAPSPAPAALSRPAGARTAPAAAPPSRPAGARGRARPAPRRPP